jgi:hypothetical protein
VAFQSADGAVTMRGNLYAAPGPKRRALVIASYPPDGEAQWQAWARELAGAGIATLTFQMPRYRDSGDSRDIALFDRDLESAVLFLESREYPLIYVLGTTSAGDAAVKLAARRKVAGVIVVVSEFMLSRPNASYDVRPDLAKVTVPKLFITNSDARANAFLAAAASPREARVFPNLAPGSGAAALNGPDSGSFKRSVQDFVLQ